MTNRGTSPVTWTARPAAPWISASPVSATLAPGQTQPFTIAVNAASFKGGSGRGVVEILDGGAVRSTIAVALAANAPPAQRTAAAASRAAGAILIADPASLSFRAPSGQTAPTARLAITSQNPSFGFRVAVAASVESAVQWLSLSSTVGSTPFTITVTANAEGLTAGAYRGAINITGEGSEPAIVPVTLVVPDIRLTAVPDSWSTTYQVGAPGRPSQTFALTSVDQDGNRVPLSFSIAAESAPGLPPPTWVTTTALSSTTPTIVTATANTAALAKGSYATSLVVTAKGASNSPLRIPVNLNVIAPRLLTSQTALFFNYHAGDARPASQVLFLSSGGSPLDFTVTASTASGGAWLKADKAGSSTAVGGALSISVDPVDLDPGVYLGAIRIDASEASNSPLILPVTLTVREASTIFVRPASVQFVSYVLIAGLSQPPAQVLTVSGGTTKFTVSATTASGGSWLTAKQLDPATPGRVQLSVKASGLSPGTYSGTVKLSAPSATDPRVDVPVTLTIAGPPRPIFSLESMALEATGGTTRSVTGEIALTGRFNFAITTTGGRWLRASPGAGSVGSIDTRTGDILPTTTPITVFADPTGLDPGTYTGTVVLNVVEDSSRYNIPVTFVVHSAPLVMSQIIDGGGGKTSLLLVNADVSPAPYTLRFWQDQGQPYPLPLIGEGLIAVSSDTIPAGGLKVMETEAVAEMGSQGWAQLESEQAVGGTVVFRRRGPGVPESEAAVPVASPLGTRFHLAFDNTEGFIAAAALVNPSPSESATVQATLHDEDGATISTDTFLLGPRGHEAFALPVRFPATAGRRGVAEFSSNLELAALGLRFNPLGAFTSFAPVAHRTTAAQATTTRLLPQVVDGGNSQSTIILVNPGDQPVPFSLAFHLPDGGPLELPIAGLGRVSEYADVIPVGGARVIQTTGAANTLVQGWGEIVSSRPIGGTLVFRLGDSEAGTPIVEPFTQQSVLPFDNTQDFVTAIALVNPSPADARTVQVRLRDEAGHVLKIESVTLPPASRQAFALPDRFPLTTNIRGTLEFGHSQISVIELRFNPRGAFTSVSPVLK